MHADQYGGGMVSQIALIYIHKQVQGAGPHGFPFTCTYTPAVAAMLSISISLSDKNAQTTHSKRLNSVHLYYLYWVCVRVRAIKTSSLLLSSRFHSGSVMNGWMDEWMQTLQNCLVYFFEPNAQKLWFWMWGKEWECEQDYNALHPIGNYLFESRTHLRDWCCCRYRCSFSVSSLLSLSHYIILVDSCFQNLNIWQITSLILVL